MRYWYWVLLRHHHGTSGALYECRNRQDRDECAALETRLKPHAIVFTVDRETRPAIGEAGFNIVGDFSVLRYEIVNEGNGRRAISVSWDSH